MPAKAPRIAVGQARPAPAVSRAAAGNTALRASEGAKRLNLELPLPPAEFCLNSRTHWAVKHKVNRQAQEAALAALLATGQRWLAFQRPQARVTFCFPTRGRRDADNLIPRCKPYWDALVRLGILPDDSIEVLGWPSYRHVYGKPGYVLIEIIEIEEDTHE